MIDKVQPTEAEVQRLQARVAELEQSSSAVSFLAHDPSLILETMCDAVLVIDTTRRFRLWNRAAEQIYGRAATEVLSKEMLAEVIAIERCVAGSTVENIRTGVATTSIWQGTTIQRHRDGRELVIDSLPTFLHSSVRMK